MTSPRLALTSSDTAHAVLDGVTTALCGIRVNGASGQPFPGAGRPVCRECVRAAAITTSSVPLRALGGRKRPGGM